MVVLATWNVENLFLPGGEFGPTSEADYEAKLAGLAHVIDGMRPDVLAVQEVGDPAALADLVARLDGDWHVATLDRLRAGPPDPRRVPLARGRRRRRADQRVPGRSSRRCRSTTTARRSTRCRRGALRVRVPPAGRRSTSSPAT